jgi:hypothetical protein
MKAGLVLATAAFLAMQPAFMLTLPSMPHAAVVCQIGSFLVLVVAVWVALLALKIADYPTCGVTEEWRDKQMKAAPPNATEKDIYGTILWGAIAQARDRVDQVCLIQDAKAKKLQVAQGLTVLALMGNVAAIMLVYVSSHAV